MATPHASAAAESSAGGFAADLRSDSASIVLARIAERLDAQRVELYTFSARSARLRDRWAAPNTVIAVDEMATIPLDWFPWSLGSVRPAEYLFVRNAGPLPMTTPQCLVGADLGIGAALMIPLIDEVTTVGALCAYWRDERESWPSEEREALLDWAFQALRPNR